jgi:hypothetical protein
MPKYFLFMLSLTTPRPLLRKEGRDSASLRPANAQNDGQFKRGVSVHEQVPNTNIKFICPEFKEKMLYAEPVQFMNFGPTPTSSSYGIWLTGSEVVRRESIFGVAV